jgi:hypothetical protein
LAERRNYYFHTLNLQNHFSRAYTLVTMHPGESGFSALQPPMVDTCTGGGKTDAGRRIPGPACAEVPRCLPFLWGKPARLALLRGPLLCRAAVPSLSAALLPSAPAAGRRPLPLTLLPRRRSPSLAAAPSRAPHVSTPAVAAPPTPVVRSAPPTGGVLVTGLVRSALRRRRPPI